MAYKHIKSLIIRSRGILFVFFIALLAAGNYSYTQVNDPDAVLESIAGKYGATGMAFVCFNQSGVTFQKYTGYSDLERKIPVSSHTIFRFASVSKSITAVGLMKLVELGLINLDEDVSRYIGFQLSNPRYPEAKISLRMLLTHTSGLLDTDKGDAFQADSLKVKGLELSEIWNTNSQYYHKSVWSRNVAGNKDFCYCNLSSGIVAAAIEKVSGKRFDEYMRDILFEPLHIIGGYGIRAVKDMDELAASYVWRRRNYVPGLDYFKEPRVKPADDIVLDYKPGDNPFLFEPQGGLRTSAAGMARLAGLFLNDGLYHKVRVLTKASVQEMLKVQWEGKGDPEHTFYHQKGLGILITDDLVPGLRLYGHTGRKTGLVSAFFFDLETKTGFVFAVNGLKAMTVASNGFIEITETIAHFYAENFLGSK